MFSQIFVHDDKENVLTFTPQWKLSQYGANPNQSSGRDIGHQMPEGGSWRQVLTVIAVNFFFSGFIKGKILHASVINMAKKKPEDNGEEGNIQHEGSLRKEAL